jgi:hypothetical protein
VKRVGLFVANCAEKGFVWDADKVPLLNVLQAVVQPVYFSPVGGFKKELLGRFLFSDAAHGRVFEYYKINVVWLFSSVECNCVLP